MCVVDFKLESIHGAYHAFDSIDLWDTSPNKETDLSLQDV